MRQETAVEQDLPRDLGSGLVMRRATIEDRDRVADFHASTLLDIGETGPLAYLHGFVLDLMSGQHPYFTPGDFLLVEETATGKIVSSMCLISQTWTYKGIPFKCGQPDIVSTDPAYRRRGLVSAQIKEIHRWSMQRAEMVQGITGIPWYYRQFGYEMALSLGANRVCFRQDVPRLKEGEAEAYRFREATAEDIPFMMAMYAQATSRSLVAPVRDEALWRYDLGGRNPASGMSARYRVIEASGATSGARPLGLLIHSVRLWGNELGTRLCEVVPGIPLLVVTPSVMRHLDIVGQEYAERDGVDFETIAFNLGEQHPVYETVADKLREVHKPYAWYIRVPDLRGFMRHITPAVEERLAGSAQAGYTGELKLNFYRTGLHLKFQEGSLYVEWWKPDRVEEGDAAFPDLTFLQLLFGFRSLRELSHAFPDCAAATDSARALLPILFPKEPSQLWSGG
ncbi:MAG: GNAT family N-acetyltransferase [Chloroflexota bacterium]|nr:GNAT family N-acetyltransferase [Chloroflexota bacterium]